MQQLLVKCGFATGSLEHLAKGQEQGTVFSLWMQNRQLLDWIVQMADLCRPKDIYLCNGSVEEYDQLCDELVQKGVFVALNPQKRPGSYACFSDPSDVARVEESTFICSKKKEDAGPTNNWKDPKEMKELLLSLFAGCMEGRTMYVIPFCMGSLQSSFSLIGVEITDSPYVVCNMKIMSRIGGDVLSQLGSKGRFIPCLHSVGQPLKPGQEDVSWPCNSAHKYIVHFPEEKSIWSFGSGYGGNALLGKKSLALRIASVMAREEGWLAEHMLIIGVTNPSGEKKYIAAAFPSQCGKTNLALLLPKIPGWKVECVGDDIAWLRRGKGGRLYAINPEAGFFGVAPGTSYESNANGMKTIEKDTIFTNVALTQDLDVWWEGLTPEPPEGLMDWRQQPYQKGSGQPAAHPNSRFTVKTSSCPIVDPSFEDPDGVPIAAILFGGRRASTVPLVYEAFSWQHGVFLGSCISSETTAAAAGTVGKLRHDPFAMLPFCGYHMGDYFSHWLDIGRGLEQPPQIFYINWFRKGPDGKFLWPGFGENIRVLAWVFDRIEGKGSFAKTPIGLVPVPGALPMEGLEEKVEEEALFQVSLPEWIEEVKEIEKYFSLFEAKLPAVLGEELQQVKRRLYEDFTAESKTS